MGSNKTKLHNSPRISDACAFSRACRLLGRDDVVISNQRRIYAGTGYTAGLYVDGVSITRPSRFVRMAPVQVAWGIDVDHALGELADRLRRDTEFRLHEMQMSKRYRETQMQACAAGGAS